MNQARFKELYELGRTTALECQLPVSDSSLPLVIIHPYMKSSGAYDYYNNAIYLKERCDKPTTTILHEIGHSVLVCLYEPQSYRDHNGDVINELWRKSINEQMANSVMRVMEYKIAGLPFYAQAATELVKNKIMYEWVYIEDMEERSKVVLKLYNDLFKDV